MLLLSQALSWRQAVLLTAAEALCMPALLPPLPELRPPVRWVLLLPLPPPVLMWPLLLDVVVEVDEEVGCLEAAGMSVL